MKVVYVKEDHISCTGENDDHPKVYYTLKNGEAVCTTIWHPSIASL